jgi:hypothetical protein
MHSMRESDLELVSIQSEVQAEDMRNVLPGARREMELRECVHGRLRRE